MDRPPHSDHREQWWYRFNYAHANQLRSVLESDPRILHPIHSCLNKEPTCLAFHDIAWKSCYIITIPVQGYEKHTIDIVKQTLASLTCMLLWIARNWSRGSLQIAAVDLFPSSPHIALYALSWAAWDFINMSCWGLAFDPFLTKEPNLGYESPPSEAAFALVYRSNGSSDIPVTRCTRDASSTKRPKVQEMCVGTGFITVNVLILQECMCVLSASTTNLSGVLQLSVYTSRTNLKDRFSLTVVIIVCGEQWRSWG